MRELLLFPDPGLRAKSKQVDKIDQYIIDLSNFLIRSAGTRTVGLAAPQYGELVQVIVYFEPQLGWRTLINPVIRRTLEDVFHPETLHDPMQSREACTSMPGYVCLVPRERKMTVKALAPSGQPVTVKAVGRTACILQHEIDHLAGVLMIDKGVTLEPAPRHRWKTR